MVAVRTLDGADLSRWMVEQGQAIAYRKYSFEYVAEEERAKAVKVGRRTGYLGNLPIDGRSRIAFSAS